MNERLKELMLEAGYVAPELAPRVQKFAELLINECIEIAASQRNPSNLNYKPSERFIEDLRQHFGVFNEQA